MKLPKVSAVKNVQHPTATTIKQNGPGVAMSQEVYVPALTSRYGQYTDCSCRCNGRIGAIEDGPVCGTITMFRG
jgi:hypothetical protein